MRGFGGFGGYGGLADFGGASVVAPPTISIAGNVWHGETLTATHAGGGTLQWYVGGVAITGETASTYVIDRADGVIGPAITCRATNAGGTTESNALSYSYALDWTAANMVSVADLGVGVTTADTGTTVDQIADQSGRSNTLSAAAQANRPAYTAADSQFNNQPTATFDGTDDWLRDTTLSTGGVVSTGTLLTVMRLVSNVNGRVCVSVNNTAARHLESTTARITASWGASTLVGNTSFLTAAHTMMSIADGSMLNRYIDGVAEGVPTAFVGTVADGGALALGGASNGSVFSNVKIAFNAFLRVALSARQIADWTEYATWRWGTP